MNLMGYLVMDNDDYPYNDTITMRVTGLSAITDLAVREIVYDSMAHSIAKINVIIDNVGARGVNNFKVGMWYYNDTTTRTEGVYSGSLPLPALGTVCYKFPDLPNHAEYFKYITAYVYTEDDNDRSNDTSSLVREPYVDLRPIRVLVEENRYDSCRVRIEVGNFGNTFNFISQEINSTVFINGTTVSMYLHNTHAGQSEIIGTEWRARRPNSAAFVTTQYRRANSSVFLGIDMFRKTPNHPKIVVILQTT